MIALLAAVALGGLVAMRVASRWASGRRPTQPSAPEAAAAGGLVDDGPAQGLLCSLGDVVLRPGGEEAWLASALVFRERAPHRDEAGDSVRTVAALFVGPERGGDRAVYARPAPDASLDWLSPVPPEALTVGAEPPSAVEHDGKRFERVRRIPLAIAYAGAGAPELGPAGVIGEYEGGGGARLLLVVGASGTRAWCGVRLEEGMYDVLPGVARP